MSDSWYAAAREHIAKIDAALPPEADLRLRKAALRAGYPWGERAHWPYKMWCKAQREYLNRFVKSDAQVPAKHLSPLERMMARGKRTAA
jgi:hypothetical protein